MIVDVRITATYDSDEIIPELDEAIRKEIESIHGNWYAQGMEFSEPRVRDISFHKDYLVKSESPSLTKAFKKRLVRDKILSHL